MAESVIRLYKTECVRHDGHGVASTISSSPPLSWVWWFNEIRLHSEIRYVTPIGSQQHPLLGGPSLY